MSIQSWSWKALVLEPMALIMQSFKLSSYFSLNSEYKLKGRATTRCLASRGSTLFSSDSIRANGISSAWEKESNSHLIDVGNGNVGTSVGEEKRRKEDIQEKLEALWDDGYGTQTIKDYLELAQESIRPDGGPPRWFTPLSSGPPLKDSPALLFLPGNSCSIIYLLFLYSYISDEENQCFLL